MRDESEGRNAAVAIGTRAATTPPEPTQLYGDERAMDPASAWSATPTYATTAVLGRGGMGEVVLARDARIGRSVALRRLREDVANQEMRARFLREARIQAHLEHPAIVPVYEVGRDAVGAPYFTMKRL